MFEWASYHTLARELAARSNDEAALRTAVSRAYYAAFCRARNFLRREGVDTDDMRSHRALWSRYVVHSDPSYQAIGDLGDYIRRHRILADYGDEFPNLAPAAEETVLIADRLLRSLSTLED